MTSETFEKSILDQLNRIIKNYKITTWLFLGTLFIEVSLLAIFFPFLIKSALFAITLAALLITIFGFYILRNYQISEKENVMRQLIQKYLTEIKNAYPNVKTPSEIRHLFGEACLSLADQTDESFNSEPSYKYSKIPNQIINLIYKFSTFMNKNDYSTFKKVAYHQAIVEFSHEVRLAPMNPQGHYKLADSYIKLSNLLKEQNEKTDSESYLKQAIEEYLILKDLLIDYPSHYLQIFIKLADCYQALGDTQNEIHILENLREHAQDNPEHLLRLGILYFSKKQASKGFKLYEVIKSLDLNKSDELMTHYR